MSMYIHRSDSVLVFCYLFAPSLTSALSVTRCNNKKFDTLMCLPGTVIKLEKAVADIPTLESTNDEGCSTTDHYCNYTIDSHTHLETFTELKRKCEGRISCDNLLVQWIQFDCSNLVYSTRLTMHYECVPAAGIRSISRCTDGYFSSLWCDKDEVIEVEAVYNGYHPGECSMINGAVSLLRGDCIRNITGLYGAPNLQNCNKLTCDIKAKTFRQVSCDGDWQYAKFTLIQYRCETDNSTDKLYDIQCSATFDEESMCPLHQAINVLQLYLGTMEKGHCTDDTLDEVLCIHPYTSNELVAKCNGANSCSNMEVLHAPRTRCDDNNNQQFYIIVYQCINTNQYTKDTCINNRMDISCPDGNVIKISSASYVFYNGYSYPGCYDFIVDESIHRCYRDIGQYYKSYYNEILGACDNKTECDLLNDDSEYTYCGGYARYTKYMTISYTCMQEIITVTSPVTTTVTVLSTTTELPVISSATTVTTSVTVLPTTTELPVISSATTARTQDTSTSDKLSTTKTSTDVFKGQTGNQKNNDNNIGLYVGPGVAGLCVIIVVVVVTVIFVKRNNTKITRPTRDQSVHYDGQDKAVSIDSLANHTDAQVDNVYDINAGNEEGNTYANVTSNQRYHPHIPPQMSAPAGPDIIPYQTIDPSVYSLATSDEVYQNVTSVQGQNMNMGNYRSDPPQDGATGQDVYSEVNKPRGRNTKQDVYSQANKTKGDGTTTQIWQVQDDDDPDATVLVDNALYDGVK